MNDEDLAEKLSQLRDGELAPDEAAAVRALLATSARARQLQVAIEAIARDLPALADRPGPPLAEPTRRWPHVVSAGLGALAAVALLQLTQPAPAELLRGDMAIDGQTEMLVGDHTWSVDGRATLSWEPQAGSARVGSAEVPMIDRTHFTAAAGGALLTLAVQSGYATLRGPDGATTVVQAGDSLRWGPSEPAARIAPITAPPAPTAPLGTTVDGLRAQVAALEEELAQARTSAQLARGQLTLEQGAPSAWPPGVDARFRQEAVAQQWQDALKALGGGDLVELDCAEYPCIAVVRMAAVEEGRSEAAQRLVDRVSAELGPVDVSIAATTAREDDKVWAINAFAIAPEGSLGPGGSASARTSWRANTLMEANIEDLASQPR